MTQRGWTMIALCMFATGCSDDTKQKTTDVGVKRDGRRDMPTIGDTFVSRPDLATKLDKPATVPDAAAACSPYVAKANSGKLCTEDTQCTANEICLLNDAGTAGECTGKCCMDESAAFDAPANLCPVPDPTKQKALCYWGFEGESDMACGFMCSITSSGKTTTYTCPNATDTCVKSTDDPDISYCDPK